MSGRAARAPRGGPADCAFCGIVARPGAGVVFQDEVSLAFLDHRPLRPGHCLVAPKTHVPTLADLPAALVGPFFLDVQMLARAVEQALEADGAFVAINIRVSQSVPHLHVHVVPRQRGDGLFARDFVWRRQPYPDEAAARAVAERIRAAVQQLTGSEPGEG